MRHDELYSTHIFTDPKKQQMLPGGRRKGMTEVYTCCMARRSDKGIAHADTWLMQAEATQIHVKIVCGQHYMEYI